MPENKPNARRYLATAIVYLALVASVFGFNAIRSRAAKTQPPTNEVAPTTPSTS